MEEAEARVLRIWGQFRAWESDSSFFGRGGRERIGFFDFFSFSFFFLLIFLRQKMREDAKKS